MRCRCSGFRFHLRGRGGNETMSHLAWRIIVLMHRASIFLVGRDLAFGLEVRGGFLFVSF